MQLLCSDTIWQKLVNIELVHFQTFARYDKTFWCHKTFISVLFGLLLLAISKTRTSTAPREQSHGGSKWILISYASITQVTNKMCLTVTFIMDCTYRKITDGHWTCLQNNQSVLLLQLLLLFNSRIPSEPVPPWIFLHYLFWKKNPEE